MLLEAIEDITKLALVVARLYFGFGAYVRRKQAAWADPLAKRRTGVLLLLVLAVSAIKLSEDVLGGESGPIDKAILVFIRDHTPSRLTGAFEAISYTGSSSVLVPLTTIVTLALLCARRRLEALLIAASVIAGAMLVFAVKAVVGRARPALWDTQWYWGSSFPSGHTRIARCRTRVDAPCRPVAPDARRSLADGCARRRVHRRIDTIDDERRIRVASRLSQQPSRTAALKDSSRCHTRIAPTRVGDQQTQP